VISSIFVANFQSLMFPQEIRLAPLTLLVGANSAGKSAVGRGMRLMQQSFEDRFVHFNGNRVNLTNFHQAVSDNDETNSMRLGIGTDESFEVITESVFGVGAEEFIATFTPDMVSFELSGQNTKVVEINAEVRFSIECWRPAYTSYDADEKAQEFGSERQDLGSGSIRFRTTRKHGSEIFVLAELLSGEDIFTQWLHADSGHGPDRGQAGGSAGNPLSLAQSKEEFAILPWELAVHFGRGLIPSPMLRNVGADFTLGSMAARRIFGILKESITLYSRISSSFQWVGPVRNISSGFQEIRQRGAVGKSWNADTKLSASGDNLQEVALQMDEFEFDELSNQLLSLTEGRFSVARVKLNSDASWVPPMGQVTLFDNDKSGKIPVAFRDAGTGISQVLPFLILAMGGQSRKISNTGAVTFVEQPELHLHPEMQSKLGDFLIRATAEKETKRGPRRDQIIAETHSEAVILRILRRIREGQISPNDVAIVAVDKFEGGGSLTQQCRISEDGSLKDELPISFTKLRMNDILGLEL